MVLRRLIGTIMLWTEPAPPWVVEWRAKTKPEGIPSFVIINPDRPEVAKSVFAVETVLNIGSLLIPRWSTAQGDWFETTPCKCLISGKDEF